MHEQLTKIFEARLEAGKRNLLLLTGLILAMAIAALWGLQNGFQSEIHALCLPLLPLAVGLCLIGYSGIFLETTVGLIRGMLPEPRKAVDPLDPEGVARISLEQFEALVPPENPQAQGSGWRQLAVHHAYKNAQLIWLHTLSSKMAVLLVFIWLFTPFFLLILLISLIKWGTELPHPHERGEKTADTPGAAEPRAGN